MFYKYGVWFWFGFGGGSGLVFFLLTLLQCGSIQRFKMGLGSYRARYFLNLQGDLRQEYMIQGVRLT